MQNPQNTAHPKKALNASSPPWKDVFSISQFKDQPPDYAIPLPDPKRIHMRNLLAISAGPAYLELVSFF
jgi:hypothetical protein